MGSARINAVRQRLAYTGKHFIKPKGTTNEMVNDDFKRPHYQDQQYTQRLDKVQKEFETMRPEILERKHGKDMGKYSVPGLNDYGSLCVDEATCGASSSALWNKLIESGFTSKQVQVVNGGYTGPGAEFSGAGISSGGKPFVGHAWLRLDDGTIIDGSAGQFMHQGTAPIERVKGKHDTKEHYEEKYSTEETREPKQKNRLRIIPPDSKLQKYYEPWFTEHPLTGRRKWFDKKNPMRKEIKKAEGSLKRIEERERAHRVAPKSARIQMARERLGAVGKIDWSEIISKRVKPDLEIPSIGAGFLSPKGEYFDLMSSDSNSHDRWLQDILKSTGDKSLMKKYDPYFIPAKTVSRAGDSNYQSVAPWLKDSGMMRLRHIDESSIGIESHSAPTSAQIRSLKTYIKDYDLDTYNLAIDDYTNSGLEATLSGRNRFNAKLRQRIALEGGRHGNRKYWLYKDGTISKESGWHNQIHPNDIGEMENGSVKITHENDIINEKHFHVDLRTHLTPKQRSHIQKQIVENKYDKLNRYGEYNINFNHGHNEKDTLSSTQKYFDYNHTSEPQNRTHTEMMGAKLRQRLGAVGLNEWESLAKKYATPITHKQHRTISWLSPNGTLYDAGEFGGTEHRDWVKTLLEKSGDKESLEYYKNENTDLDEVVDSLWSEDSGFARVNTFGGGELDIGFGDEPTKAQIKSIQDLAISRGYTSENIVVDGSELSEQKQLRRRMGLHKLGKLRQRIAGLGFRERILNWLKEQPRFKSFDPDSSFVGTVKYDQDNQTMQIELNGKKYDFCNVEERLFDSFSGAGSKGAFFNREIKSLHNCGAW